MIISKSIFFPKKIHPENFNLNTKLHQNLEPIKDHFQYLKIDTANPLSNHINKTFEKIDFHKARAKQLKDTNFVFKDKKVYGSMYEFIGNSATNFQFYLTDSMNHFVRSELLIRRKPNYDSLQPTLNYIKTDLIQLINTFEWVEKK